MCVCVCGGGGVKEYIFWKLPSRPIKNLCLVNVTVWAIKIFGTKACQAYVISEAKGENWDWTEFKMVVSTRSSKCCEWTLPVILKSIHLELHVFVTFCFIYWLHYRIQLTTVRLLWWLSVLAQCKMRVISVSAYFPQNISRRAEERAKFHRHFTIKSVAKLPWNQFITVFGDSLIFKTVSKDKNKKKSCLKSKLERRKLYIMTSSILKKNDS